MNAEYGLRSTEHRVRMSQPSSAELYLHSIKNAYSKGRCCRPACERATEVRVAHCCQEHTRRSQMGDP